MRSESEVGCCEVASGRLMVHADGFALHLVQFNDKGLLIGAVGRTLLCSRMLLVKINLKMNQVSVLRVCVGALVCFGIGCAGDVSEEVDADTFSTHPLLVVEQSANMQGSESVRSHASLSFLRLADERDFSAAIDLVSPRADVPHVGSCDVVRGRQEPLATPMVSRVELAFAGDVNMKADGVATPLTLRFFPNVADLVAGVTYTLQDKNDLTKPFGGELVLQTTGSSELEPMQGLTQPPMMPSGITVQGGDLAAENMPIAHNEPLRLSWNPGSSIDSIYIDLEPMGAAARDKVIDGTKVIGAKMRCSFADTGTATIPAEVVPQTDQVTIVVHRVRDIVLKSDSLGMGMAHFDLSVSALVRFAP